MRKEIIDRRRRRTVVRAFPLFVGYIFVEGIPRCDGVAEVLGVRLDGKPAAVPMNVVETFRVAENGLEFDDTTEARVKRREQGRNRRETVKMQFPEGMAVMVKEDGASHPMAGFHGHVVSVTGRGMVRAMMNLFGGTVPVEIDARALEAA